MWVLMVWYKGHLQPVHSDSLECCVNPRSVCHSALRSPFEGLDMQNIHRAVHCSMAGASTTSRLIPAWARFKLSQSFALWVCLGRLSMPITCEDFRIESRGGGRSAAFELMVVFAGINKFRECPRTRIISRHCNVRYIPHFLEGVGTSTSRPTWTW